MADICQLTVRLDAETLEQLKFISETLKRPMNKLVQQAVVELLARESQRLSEQLSPRVEKLRLYAKRAGSRDSALAGMTKSEAAHAKEDAAEGTRVTSRDGR